MDERTTLEIIAPSVEEALAQGLEQLKLTADAVTFEVLDAGNKGFLGLGGRQVRIRLIVNAPAVTISKPNQNVTLPKQKPETELVQEPQIMPQPEVEHDQLLDNVEEVVSKMLHLMRLQAQVSAHYANDVCEDRKTVHVDIRGNDLGVLIGRRSETLNALQLIASLIVSKAADQWVQLIVDVEGYRTRREHQLRQMARRIAEQAIKTGKRQVLEPMTPNERRIIHLELREHPDVETESIGEEPNRKVTIILKHT
jgi:spoIIIJ-associated protein